MYPILVSPPFSLPYLVSDGSFLLPLAEKQKAEVKEARTIPAQRGEPGLILAAEERRAPHGPLGARQLSPVPGRSGSRAPARPDHTRPQKNSCGLVVTGSAAVN